MNGLQQIIEAFERLGREGGTAVLATVVGAAGSTYRRAGARMLVADDGQVTGSISGGCLERDVIRRARQVMHSGEPAVAVYDSTSDDDEEETFALGCNGVVEVLIERLPAGGGPLGFLTRCLRTRRTAVMATVLPEDGAAVLGRVSVSAGEAPVVVGVDDTVLIDAIVKDAHHVLRAGEARTAIYETQAGRAAVFLEVVRPPVQVVVFGGGHDAIPLVGFAKALGWHVSVVDRRPGYATRTRFPTADELIVADPELAAARIPIGPETLAVVMNHNLFEDLKALKLLLASPARYIGLLGPTRRKERLLAELGAACIAASEFQRERLYGPVGLDIGADTPEEVALAIVAEMNAVVSGRGAGPSRERQGPLHERSGAVPVSLGGRRHEAVVCGAGIA